MEDLLWERSVLIVSTKISAICTDEVFLCTVGIEALRCVNTYTEGMESDPIATEILDWSIVFQCLTFPTAIRA